MYHKIVLAGGSGFLGKALADYYKDKAEEIVILSRRKGRDNGHNLRNLVHLGLGGHQGTGSQFISWIHVQDFVRSTEWLLQNESLNGTYNCTSPEAITNKDFMKLMRKTYGVPFGIPSPKWMLEMGAFIIGTETELVLKSRWVYPKRLLDSGFRFSFPKAGHALHELAGCRV